MQVYILHQDEFAERVAGHIINDIHFCTSCGNGCNNCRVAAVTPRPGAILGYEAIEATGDFIEEPERHLPAIMPAGIDVLIPVGLHPDVLSAIPQFAARHGIPAVIVPVEHKDWCPLGLQYQLAADFTAAGIQHAFPRPFCMLDVDPDDASRSIIRRFQDEFKVGKPRFELTVRDGRIVAGHVLQSQPCGCAYYMLQQLREERVFDECISLDEKISLAHHAFPCSASMDKDLALDDSPLHVAGYAARDAIHDAIEVAIGTVDRGKFHKGQACAP